MQIQDCKAGEQVVLISGGPVMAVKGIVTGDPLLEEKEVQCQWFMADKLQSGSFAPESLRKATDDEKLRQQL